MALATPTNQHVDATQVLNVKSKTSWALRAALVATASYVASSHMPCLGAPSVGVIVTTASVDSTSLELIVEGSIDGTTFFALPAGRHATTAVPLVLTAASYESATDQGIHLTIPTEGGGVNYLRCKVKRTGGSAVGTVAITGIVGGSV